MILLLFAHFLAIAEGSEYIRECPPSRVSVEDSMYHSNILGLTALVINATDVLYDQAFGYDSPVVSDERRPIDTMHTIFVLASISKTFIAVAVMQLVESNQLNLDRDINHYLSTSRKVIHPLYPNHHITLRHILSHTSSIGPNFNEEIQHYLPGDNFVKTNLSDVIFRYTSNKSNWLVNPPGTIVHYSNIGVSLDALIVEQVTKIPFERYIHEKILEPLSIYKNEAGYRLSDFAQRKQDLIRHYLFNSSWLETAQRLLPRLNITQVDNASDWLHIPHFGVSDYPAGLLRMSTHSLARYLQSFLNNFVPILLNSSSLNEMIRVQATYNQELQLGLVWNWRILHRKRLVGHRGAMPGITNVMMVNERRTLGVIILSNGDVTKSDDLAKQVDNTIMTLLINLFQCFE